MKRFILTSLAAVSLLAAPQVRAWTYNDGDVLLIFRNGSQDVEFDLGSVNQFLGQPRKVRHHKRRLIQDEVIAELAQVLRPGGRLRFVTDWEDYAAWTLERFGRSADFAWTAQRAADWRGAPADHVTTRYETKRLGDCAPVFLAFERIA